MSQTGKAWVFVEGGLLPPAWPVTLLVSCDNPAEIDVAVCSTASRSFDFSTIPYPVDIAGSAVIVIKAYPAKSPGGLKIASSGVPPALNPGVGEFFAAGLAVVSAHAAIPALGSSILTGSGGIVSTSNITALGNSILSGSGGIVSGATVTSQGRATLNGSAEIASGAGRFVLGTWTVSGSGGLGDGAEVIALGSSILSGTGGIGSGAEVTALGSSILSGTGGIVSGAEVIGQGKAKVSGTGGISSGAEVTGQGVTKVSGSGGISSGAEATALGKLTVAATPAFSIHVHNSGQGAVKTSGSGATTTGASITAQGKLTAKASATTNLAQPTSSMGSVKVSGLGPYSGSLGGTNKLRSQTMSGVTGAGGNIELVALSPISEGDLIVVCVGVLSGQATSVSDTTNGTYTEAVNVTDSAGVCNTSVWFFRSLTNIAGPMYIYVGSNGVASCAAGIVVKYVGELDTTGSNRGTLSVPSSPTITTGAVHTILVAAECNQVHTAMAAPSGWASIYNDYTNVGAQFSYLIDNSGPNGETATWATSSAHWAAVIASFK